MKRFHKLPPFLSADVEEFHGLAKVASALASVGVPPFVQAPVKSVGMATLVEGVVDEESKGDNDDGDDDDEDDDDDDNDDDETNQAG